MLLPPEHVEFSRLSPWLLGPRLTGIRITYTALPAWLTYPSFTGSVFKSSRWIAIDWWSSFSISVILHTWHKPSLVTNSTYTGSSFFKILTIVPANLVP